MAKLKAHGTEVARFSMAKDVTTPDRYVTWERVTYAIMSDGVVLRKIDVRFKPADYEREQYPNGRPYSYGWKKNGKLKNPSDPQPLVDLLTSKGYVRE